MTSFMRSLCYFIVHFSYKKKSSSKSRSEFFGQILIQVRFGANKILVCSLIHMCYGLVVKTIIGFAHTPIFKVLLILGLE